MTKKRLIKAPLVLVQAQIHFSTLPTRDLGTEKELESLHKAMIKLGFAERIDSEVVEVGFQFNPEVVKDGYVELKQQKSNSKRLIFRGFGKSQSVELVSNHIIIKNSQYENYIQYSAKIKDILKVFTANLSDLKDVLTKQISIRYIDVILPSKENELSHYIDPCLLPFHPKFSTETSGISQSVTKTGDNQFIVISTEEVKAEITGFPGRWLPADMLESDQRAVLMLNPYIESYSVGKNYGILNIDHRIDLPNTPIWETTEIINQLNSLYTLSSQLFWDVISDTAKQEWEENCE
jgi:uncharacterized protein (TIGR04255 family)